MGDGQRSEISSEEAISGLGSGFRIRVEFGDFSKLEFFYLLSDLVF